MNLLFHRRNESQNKVAENIVSWQVLIDAIFNRFGHNGFDLLLMLIEKIDQYYAQDFVDCIARFAVARFIQLGLNSINSWCKKKETVEQTPRWNLTNRKSTKMVIKRNSFDGNSIIDIFLNFNGSSYLNISDFHANFKNYQFTIHFSL